MLTFRSLFALAFLKSASMNTQESPMKTFSCMAIYTEEISPETSLFTCLLFKTGFIENISQECVLIVNLKVRWSGCSKHRRWWYVQFHLWGRTNNETPPANLHIAKNMRIYTQGTRGKPKYTALFQLALSSLQETFTSPFLPSFKTALSFKQGHFISKHSARSQALYVAITAFHLKDAHLWGRPELSHPAPTQTGPRLPDPKPKESASTPTGQSWMSNYIRGTVSLLQTPQH